MRLPTLVSGLLFAAAASLVSAQEETGEHAGWPRWCGKVYESGYPSFEPGGRTTAPAASPNGTSNLSVQFKPRYSIYLSGEATGSFVVNAALSPWSGAPYENATSNGVVTEPFTELVFSINSASDDAPLVQNRIAVNATGLEFQFDLSQFEPRTEAYEVVFFGSSIYGDKNYTATSSFLYLPDNPEGSATKIDHLNGGLLFKSAQTEQQFVPLLPYGYYGLYNGSNDTAATVEFVQNFTSNGRGLNAIVSLAGFADTNPVYDAMDELGLHFMFDLRGSFRNLTETEIRVNTIKHHTSLFAYWSADEPDGWQYPFDETPAAQELIHRLDPYHPVAVTLNCQDYYFAEYSIGADILMEDVYPIGINGTFSKWGTACNATLGDCGCDNCEGTVQDVTSRLDDLIQYEKWLGRWPLPKFHNPQVFHGEDYWFRDPTAGEARVMNALAFNRGVTGIFGWTWPGNQDLFAVHSEMASVFTTSPVRDFILGGQPTGRLFLSDPDLVDIVDMAYWIQGNQIMVSVVNGAYVDIEGSLSIPLPAATTGIESVPFGGLSWQLLDGALNVDAIPAMSASIIVLVL